MKKVIKSLVAIAAVSMATTACQKEIDAPIESTHIVNFTLSVDPSTKTTVTEGAEAATFAWEADDASENKFHIFENGTAGTVASATLTDGVMSIAVSFTGEEASSYTYTGFYSTNTSGDLATLSNEQNSKAGAYDPNQDILVLKSTTTETRATSIDLILARVVAINKMTLKELTDGEAITSVKVYSDKPLAGNYDITTATWSNEINSIAITPLNLTIADGCASLSFLSRPAEGATLTVVVETDADKTYAKTFGGEALSFPENTFTKFGVKLGSSETETLFYESFDTNAGKGGNDGSWSGNIASNSILSDNTGWTFTKGNGAYNCAKFGATSAAGSAVTPAIGAGATSAILTFKAGAWNASTESTTLNLSIDSEDSELSASSVNLKLGAFSDYAITVDNLTADSKITFASAANSKSRFFLDEVKIITSSKIASVTPKITASATTLSLEAGEVEDETISISTENITGDVTVSCDADWLDAEINDQNKLYIVADANDGEERTATITLSYDGAADVVITVTQAAKVEEITTIAGITSSITATTSATANTVSANLTGAVVSYVNGSNAYIEDETGGVLLYNSKHALTAGQKISGSITCTGYLYSNLPELTALTTTDAEVTSGAEIPCTIITISELNTNFSNYISRRIKLEGVTVSKAFANKETGEFKQDDNTIMAYGKGTGVALTKETVADVIVFPTVYGTTKEVNVWEQPSNDAITAIGTTISFASESLTINVGDAATINAATVNSGATVSYSSSDEKIATVDSNTGAVTPVAVGTATITASVAANGKYTAVSASYTVTVNASGTEVKETTITLSEQGYSNGTTLNGTSTTSGDITLSYSKGEGSSNPAYYTTGTAVRLYAKNTLKITAGTYTITSIVITYSDSSYTGTIVTDTGSYSLSSTKGTWAGSSSSVTFTNSASNGQARIQKIEVTYK